MAVQVLLFGGWPVDCANRVPGILRRVRIKPLRGLGRIRRRQGCDLDSASINAWNGGRHRDEGAFELESRGWSGVSSALTVA